MLCAQSLIDKDNIKKNYVIDPIHWNDQKNRKNIVVYEYTHVSLYIAYVCEEEKLSLPSKNIFLLPLQLGRYLLRQAIKPSKNINTCVDIIYMVK